MVAKDESSFFSLTRIQSMSDHFTKILSRMELNDLRSEDGSETNAEDERRIVNGNKNTFGTFFEQMKFISVLIYRFDICVF